MASLLRRRIVALALMLCLALSAAIPLSAHAESGTATPETDGVLITLAEGQETALSLLSDDTAGGNDTFTELTDLGFSITDTSESANGSLLLEAQAPEGLSDQDAAAAASQIEGVAAAQPNYVYELLDDEATIASLIPVNDPYALMSTSSTLGNQYWIYAANFIGAWREAADDRSQVTIAVLDSGVRLDHEDLSGSILRDLAWDAANQASLLETTTAGDDIGHGTHVSGICAGIANNGIGVAGASLGATILPVKVTNDAQRATSATLIAAYNYLFQLADSGACDTVHVANLSLGGHSTSLNDPALHAVIKKARDSYKILSVCAGGNSHSTGSTEPDDYIYPGDFEECVSVTELNADGTNRANSEFNDAKDISTYGESIWSSTSTGSTSYGFKTGTSMACAVVSGCVALMLSACPDATLDEVCEALYSTADPIEDSENDRSSTSGSAGSLDAQAAFDKLLEEKKKVSFSDVSDGEWYTTSVVYVARRSIMGGYSNTTLFGPDDLLLREQMAQLLYNYLADATDYPDAPLTDLDRSAYYDAAVNWVYDKQIMNGYADGTARFGVGDPITREQLVTTLANLLATDDELARADTTLVDAIVDGAQTSDWARASMAWALQNGVISGVETETGRELQPQATATRAQIAAVVANAMQAGLM